MAYPSKTNRETILATAMDQVAQAGMASLTIRGLADTLGLAPNALYRYFPNADALAGALADESRLRLLKVLEKSVERKTPENAIRGIANAYVRFAREHPHLFALTLKPSPEEGLEEPSHRRAWRFLLEHVSRLYGQKEAAEAAVTLWAFVHGTAVLAAAGVFEDAVKPTSGFEFGLEMWIRSAPRG